MEESVALDSSKQKKFVKSVRGIKKLLKKKDKKEPEKPVVLNKKSDVPTKKGNFKKRQTRGLVYLSHIPHGFYEQQMTEYFKQFGVVTNARVIRSPRTGNSKGYAFVEFKEPAVAEIVAETMNNYLMGKRLIKAAYIPPEKQKSALRKKWNTQNNPSFDKRLLFKKTHNADQTDEQELKIAMKLLSSLSKTKQKLTQLGIDYDFFKPVDVPEALIDKLDDITETDVKPKKQVKDESKDLKSEVEIKTEPGDIKVDVETDKRIKKQRKRKHSKPIEISNSNETLVKEAIVKSDQTEVKSENEQNKEDNKINKRQKEKKEENKQEKLKKAGVKALENFISIKEPDDSDSSIDFDSDEFDKMIENEDDDLSSGEESEPDGEFNDESELEDKDKQEIIKVGPKTIPKSSESKEKDIMDTGTQKKQAKGNVKNQSVKRKTTQGAQGSFKKAKFEKQNIKMPLNKVIKKRK